MVYCRHEPRQPDPFHQQVWIDALTNSLADNSTPGERRRSITVLNLPVEAQAWARQQGLPLLADFTRAENTVSQGPDQLVLLSPSPNTTYRIDPNFDPAAQQLQIEVAVGQGISQITVWMDGNQLTSLSSPPYQAWWTLSEGEHQFWVQGVDANGRAIKSDVVVTTVISK